jgi:hypothetical protein
MFILNATSEIGSNISFTRVFFTLRVSFVILTFCKNVRLAKDILHCTASSETTPNYDRDGMAAAMVFES